MPTPLDPARAARAFDLVGEALDLPPGERAAFVQTACGEDAVLRAEVESLLSHQGGTAAFLAQPAFVIDPDLWQGVAEGELRAGDELGDCRIVSLLGEGGMGEVYLAEDTVLGRQVAVKLLKRQFGEEVSGQRFRHERRVLAGLTHPNIARLYGSGATARGQAYLVMEYVEGERLDRFCAARGLGIDERLALFRKVCAAVAHAHQNLVVHRDLKPANIRVTPEGEPKLLDFGIAKLLDPEGDLPPGSPADVAVTLHGPLTPEYASPEQLRGEAITTASDVYSLGVILYELLCGQRPYRLKTRRADELARAICEQDPPPPSTVASRSAVAETSENNEPLPGDEPPGRLRRRLAGDLDNIVAKALRKEPARRYGSVAAFSEDIRRHGEGLPVSARRDTLGYRAGKFVRRNQAGVAAAVLVLLSLVAGLIVATWQAKLARQERDRARVAQKQSQRLNAFLESLLGSVDPEKMGKDVKVAQVLDAASQRLDAELAGEPQLLAEAHTTLARAYSHLGLLEPAEQHARAALAAARQLHRPDDPPVAEAEDNLAKILCDRFEFQAAAPLLQHALAVERRQPIPDHAALANTLGNLSYSLVSEHQARAAEPLAREALVHARLAWGERDAGYLAALNGLANIKVEQQDFPAAEALYRRLIALYDQLSPGGIGSIAPQINLCICLFNEEKFAVGVPVAARLEQDARRLVGEQGLPYAVGLYARGCFAFAEGRYPEAIAPLRQALAVLTVNYPPGQTTVVQCRGVLGLCLTRTGQAAEGEPLLRTALAEGAALDRKDFDHTFGNLETALGECLLAQQRYAEAEKFLRPGHDELTRRLGPQNRLTVQATRRMHDLYTAWDKPAQAASYPAAPSAP